MDEYDPHPEFKKNMTEEEIAQYRANDYRLKHDSITNVTLYLMSKAGEVALGNPKHAIRLLHSAVEIQDEEAPPITSTETFEDYLAYLAKIAPILIRWENEGANEWAKDHFLK